MSHHLNKTLHHYHMNKNHFLCKKHDELQQYSVIHVTIMSCTILTLMTTDSLSSFISVTSNVGEVPMAGWLVAGMAAS